MGYNRHRFCFYPQNCNTIMGSVVTVKSLHRWCRNPLNVNVDEVIGNVNKCVCMYTAQDSRYLRLY